jgi:hypothetical protein
LDKIESAPPYVPGNVYDKGVIVRKGARIYRALACTARSYFSADDWEPVTIDEPARLAPAFALGRERAVQASSSEGEP